MGHPTPAAPALPEVTTEVLTSIYQHRLLTTAQVHAMHMPDRTRRWVEQVLAYLALRGLTAFVRPGRGGPRLYYLTLAGARAVELIPTRVETRRKLITPEQAAGPLWRHTLAVNDTGIAFMQAARERNDDFGSLGWRHEIAHQAPPTGHARGELLISDALLIYLALGPRHELTFHYRLLELDRATALSMPVTSQGATSGCPAPAASAPTKAAIPQELLALKQKTKQYLKLKSIRISFHAELDADTGDLAFNDVSELNLKPREARSILKVDVTSPSGKRSSETHEVLEIGNVTYRYEPTPSTNSTMLPGARLCNKLVATVGG